MYRRVRRASETAFSLASWHGGLIRRLQRRPVGRLLVYHNVSAQRDPVFGIDESAFARQMAFLAQHYHVVTLDDLAGMLAGAQPWIERAVAITFDDGYEDNYLVAWPILRKSGLPATIYLPTDYIGSAEGIWLNRLHVALRMTPLDRLEAPELLGGEPPFLSLRSSAERFAGASLLVDRLYDLAPRPRKALAEALIERLKVDLASLLPRPSALRFLNWDQAREMAGGLVTFGSHGCSHSIVSRLADDVLRDELTASKAIIEREMGRPVRHFAYPNGTRGDWDRRAVELLPELGYATAVINCRGLVEAGTDPFELPRVGYAGSHMTTFAKRLEGLTARRALRALKG